MILSTSLLIAIIAFILVSILIIIKYHSEKRKWIDAMHMQLNRVRPDNRSFQWRTVSSAQSDAADQGITSTRIKSFNVKKSEFQYVPFETEKRLKRIGMKTKTESKGVQSNLEMIKEKVVPIARIINEQVDNKSIDFPSETTTKTYVTSKEIETNQPTDIVATKLIKVHMSEQTQSIIKAIRNELNKFSSLEKETIQTTETTETRTGTTSSNKSEWESHSSKSDFSEA